MQACENTDQMWSMWKGMFMSVTDKHAPLKRRRVKHHSMPWVDSDIKKLMIERDRMKRKFVVTKNDDFWNEYKRLRNKVNLALRNFGSCQT